jgi:hypothetical protein
VLLPLSSVEAVPTGQGVHTAALPNEYVPAPHGRHTNRPTVDAYCPAAQGWHPVAPVLMLEAVPTGQGVHALAFASE